jgi:ABC-2 type transport system permease protein
MLNCGLGILLIPASGVLLLLKGRAFCDTIGQALADRSDCAAVLICAALCMLSSMNDMAAPSVSLEGKNLWIVQSLPVEPKTALRAKASVQLILTGLPMLFASVCAAFIVPAPPAVKALVCVTPLSFAAFSAVFSTVVGIRMPLLNWTNELAPIKQGGAVAIALFSGWGVSIALAGLYLLIGYKIGAALYLLIWTVLFAAAALLLLRWLDTRGSRMFEEL